MKELIDFIKECEHNIEINKKNNLENRIDLDHVLERLKDIEKEYKSVSNYERAIRGEIDRVIEEEVMAETENAYIEDIPNEELDKIASLIVDDDELNCCLNETILWYLTHCDKMKTY